MEIPTMLVKALVEQMASDLGWSAARDVEVIQHRCRHEGLSFLTITLPLLSDSLERGLEEGRLTCPNNFVRHGSLPRLLGGFFRRVFAPNGVCLPNPCVDSIFAIRQICRFFKKLKIDCSPKRKLMAIRKYKQVEEELYRGVKEVNRQDPTLDLVYSCLWPRVFPEVEQEDLVCRHGPGVTAERLSPNKRFDIQYWYTRFEQSFPLDLHGFHNYDEWSRMASGEGTDIKELSVLEEIPVRVVFVPKTLTSPRVIAIEPSSMQYVQQSLMIYMVDRLESHYLTKYSVRFTDQSVNQSLARSSSIDRSLATLDMSDASDRVSRYLVDRLFKSSGLRDYLSDARSLHAELPDKTNVLLTKFASMGSAICFPVEACVFYTLILAAMHSQDQVRPSTRSIVRYSRSIDIYGDDIVIPVDYVDAVIPYLESYGLKVNVGKSFRFSLFRESCGGDFFNGISVKPIYLRELPSDGMAWTPNQIMSLTSTANQFYQAGMWRVASALRGLVQSAVKTNIPLASFEGDGLFFSSFFQNTDCRYDSAHQNFRQKRQTYKPKFILDHMPSSAAYFNKFFLSKAHVKSKALIEYLDSRLDFEASVKRGVFKPIRRWVAVMPQ